MGKPTQHIAESSRMKTLPWKPPSEVLVAVLFLLKRIQWKEKKILTPSMRWGPHLPGLAWFHKQPLCLWAFFPFNCISKVSHRSPGVSHVLGFQGEGQQGLRPGLWFNVHCDLIQRTKLTASDRCSQCYFMYLSKILCWSETTPSQTHSTTEVVSDPREKSQGIIRKLSTDFSLCWPEPLFGNSPEWWKREKQHASSPGKQKVSCLPLIQAFKQ